MLLSRAVLLGLMLVWLGGTSAFSGNWLGSSLCAASLLAGLAVLITLGRPAERPWNRYAIVALDLATMATAAIQAPLLAGEAVPQFFVFRAYGTHMLWFAPIVSSLALSPALTAFAGAGAATVVWVVYLAVTADMETVRSWSDLPAEVTAQDCVALLLDPAFIGRGNRIEESAGLMLGGLLLAYAVHRARGIVAAHAAANVRRRRVEQVFGRHVPEAVAGRLLAAPDAFSPTRHEGTALHLDAAGSPPSPQGATPQRCWPRSMHCSRRPERRLRQRVAWWSASVVTACWPLSGCRWPSPTMPTGR